MYLIVDLVFPTSVFEVEFFFLIALFPDHCLLVPFFDGSDLKLFVLAWPTGGSTGVFLLLQIFSDVVRRTRLSIAGQLIVSVSSRFLFILDVIVLYFFVIDDLLTSMRFTTRTEQLTKCCGPLQTLMVRLGTVTLVKAHQ